jgi:hypothetical protein
MYEKTKITLSAREQVRYAATNWATRTLKVINLMCCPFNSGMIPGQGEVLEYRLGLPRSSQRVPVQSLLCHVQVQLHLMKQISVRCN